MLTDKFLMTPWYDGDQQPARIGQYERMSPNGNPYRSDWDGKFWRSIEDGGAWTDQKAPWRGLAANPHDGVHEIDSPPAENCADLFAETPDPSKHHYGTGVDNCDDLFA